MKTTTGKNRRTPFLKKENIIAKYNSKTSLMKVTPPVILPQTDRPEKQPVRFFRPKPLIKALAATGTSSFWL